MTILLQSSSWFCRNVTTKLFKLLRNIIKWRFMLISLVGISMYSFYVYVHCVYSFYICVCVHCVYSFYVCVCVHCVYLLYGCVCMCTLFVFIIHVCMYVYIVHCMYVCVHFTLCIFIVFVCTLYIVYM